jgi:enediyne biosynthesis protein E4
MMRYLLFLALLGLSAFQPLPERKQGSNGDTLFTLLSSDQTNIRFNNKLKDLKEHNIMIYSNFYGGAGVAIGDLNGDGLQDIFFAGNQVGDQLYFNRGKFKFEDVTRKAGIKDNGGWSSGVIFGDVNQDGHLDIYVTRELYDDDPELRKNKLYINQGDGTFKEEAEKYGVDNDARTRHAAFLDYDKDGDLDLFLCNQPPNPGHYSKFLNSDLSLPEYRLVLYANEGGRFVDVTHRAGLARTGFPNSVTCADLNNDGWTDLFIANDFWVEDWIFINNGDGTFTNELYERANHISFSSMGVDAGDIDNDGDLDVMVVDMAAEDNYRLKTNMSGMNPKAFWKVVNEGGHYQYMFNMLHLNQGDGYFSDIAQMTGMANTDWSWSTLIADFDNNGWKDIHVTNGLMRDIRNNDASKKFPQYLESKLFEYIQNHPNPPADITVWDVVDIKTALEIVPSQKLSNYVYANNGHLDFTRKMKEWGMDQESFSNGSAYADLDNDGDLDLVINNINDVAFVYQNNAAQQKENYWLRIEPVADKTGVVTLGTKVSVKSNSGPQYFEITGVRGMYSQSELIAHFGLGKDAMADTVIVTWPDGRLHILTEVKANQLIRVLYSESVPRKEVVATKSSPLLSDITAGFAFNYQHKENDFDDFEKQVLIPQKMSTQGPQISVGDINGDGLDDLFIGGAAGNAGQLFLQDENSGFKPLKCQALEDHRSREDVGSLFFDADQDGDLDLYVVSGGNEFAPGHLNYQDRLYLNDGSGHFTFEPERLPDFRSSGSKVRACDFDQDGDLDLIVAGRHIPWAYPEPASSVLLVNDQGFFRDETANLAPDLRDIGMINDVVWTDYNQDGLQDLVLVGEWTPVIILENQRAGFKRMSIPALDGQKGWWFSVEAADLDHDGDDDLLVGNLGLNYKYKASEAEPFEVYYYDFDNNGSKDVVLTYYNFGIQYPLRGRECSSQQVPMIKEKFENYDLFASSDVFEVYGENKLADALHLEATNFASLYIENQGGGRFRVSPLPIDAQISTVNDFIVHDFNQDGHPDVLMAGNMFDAEVETTRADGGFGLLMLGDGTGHFKPLSKKESGFFVPYDVKSLSTVNHNGKTLVLVGCNNAPLRLFDCRKSMNP